jgi:antitoxin component of MazEF toxin-antitoxin module
MIEITTKARKWGSSLGVSLPKHIVKAGKIKVNQEITLFLQENPVDFSNVFNTLKISKPTQDILDTIREGED